MAFLLFGDPKYPQGLIEKLFIVGPQEESGILRYLTGRI
jgi:hypothetical protein